VRVSPQLQGKFDIIGAATYYHNEKQERGERRCVMSNNLSNFVKRLKMRLNQQSRSNTHVLQNLKQKHQQ
jgi:hypothetical protein